MSTTEHLTSSDHPGTGELASPYLSGAYAPVRDEVTLPSLSVSGELPDGLRGTFLRNGPNPMFEPVGEYHLFDGDGMLHAATFDGTSVAYRNRWIRSAGLEAEIRAGHAIYGGMAQPVFPDRDLVGDAGPMKNVANTHVVRHAGRTMCLWEAGPPTLVDEALDTIGTHDFDGALVGPMTAHPKFDPATGELHFFGYSAMAPYLRYHVADASGRLVRSLDIDLPNPVMMHDFAITEHHVVFFDAPARFDLSGFLSGGPMIRWQPELGTRIGVMRRDGDGTDLRWAEIEPCYVFHFLNAWSDDSTLHLDGCRLPRLDIGLESDSSDPGDGSGHLTRFTVDLAAATATTTQLTDIRGDFPRIDDRATGREHHVGYLATILEPRRDGDPPASSPEEGAFDSITRIDLADGTTRSHRFGPGRTCGEPVFAPDPDRDGEDGGWLLTYVHDAATDRCDLVVLDAADVEAAPVATVHTGRRVPFGFHGAWISAAT